MHKMGASKRFADKSKESFPSISINRHEEAYLSEQVAESLRTAIQTGFYRAGDALPPLRTIMKKAGVSLRVAREAMRRLADENLVISRPRAGCRVLPARAKCLHGRVLAVVAVKNLMVRHQAVLLAEIGRIVSKAGYLFEIAYVFMSKSGRVDMTPIEDKLRAPVSLTLAFHPTREVTERLSSLPVPYVKVTSVSESPCTTHVRVDPSHAIGTFVDACMKHGVRNVLVAAYGAGRRRDDALKSAGMSVERMEFDVEYGLDVLENLEQKSMNAFLHRFGDARGRCNMPDVIVVNDDFVERGAMTALNHLGIWIPDDVFFVGVACKGAAPCHVQRLSRFEVDPVEEAKVVADAVLGHLDGKTVPHEVCYASKFRFGDSFPRPTRRSQGEKEGAQ